MIDIIAESAGDEFQVSLDDLATIFDLKSELDKEHVIGEPERQTVFYLGLPITDDSTLVQDLTKINGNRFHVNLPLAAADDLRPYDGQKFLILGKDTSFMAIDLTPKLSNEQCELLLKQKKFGISYQVDGSEIGKRIFHVDVYEVAKLPSKTKTFNIEVDGDKVFQSLPDGSKEQLLGTLHAYDESKNMGKYQKAKIISEIVANFGSFLGGILGAVV